MLVLLTGARGFVGRRLSQKLQSLGRHVIELRRDGGSTSHAGYGAALASPHLLQRVEGADLRVVHLAWDLTHKHDWAAQARCVADSAALFAGLASLRPCQVVALGSADEYGCVSEPVAETHPTVEPRNAYGWAKHALCEFLTSWRSPGTSIVWLRPFLIYGPGQEGAMLVPTAVRALTEGRASPFSDGAQLRDFVHVDDVVDAIVATLDRALPGLEVINVGTGHGVRVRDFLMEMASQRPTADAILLGALPRRVDEPEVLVANVERASALLGWRARIDWRAGIRTLF